MEQDQTSPQWLPACLQLFDSALPTGAYAHSHGLEGLVQAGEIKSVQDILEFLHHEVSDALTRSDLPVFREAYGCVLTNSFEQIPDLEALAGALRPTFELRKAGMQIGRQTWKLYHGMLQPGTREQNLHTKAGEFLETYQSVVVCGLLSAIMQIPLENAMTAYARQAVANFAQACIKLLGFGPTAVQAIIHEVSPACAHWVESSLAIALEDTGSMAPRWDMASSEHQFAERRLYIS